MLINNEEHSDLCVGIDLGTTNSVLATVNIKPNGDIVSKVVDLPRAVDLYNSASGQAKLSSQKKPLLPSCVYYNEKHNFEPLVGDFAKMQYPNRPHLVAKSIKSQMGKALAEGLSEDIPDKTPAEVSARILKHMIKEAGKIYRQNIEDAVITVPANFDSVMCKATRDAASIAGIKVLNSDGSERPVLLSEPNAVIYDLINQVQNGEISNHIIDLNSEKFVMVFDLGGGTLDITMHRIKRREDCPDVLKVDEIATNRYTLLGGDDFDEAIAKVMFEHYLNQYSRHPEIVASLRKQEKSIMPQMLNYAEQLKIDISERYRDGEEAGDSGFGWDDDEDSEETFDVGGNMGGIGYAYDDSFTKESVEAILNPFMGSDLSFNDYHNADNISDSRNIIYPILDVLKKSADKLQTEPKVDAVIVNGGMSKFYMVIDRLKAFFGLDPIVALDPDQAVARGAAVYHYYLHRYAEKMQEDMRLLHDEGEVAQNKEAQAVKPSSSSDQLLGTAVHSAVTKETVKPKLDKGIDFGNTILNDALYLGARNGAVQLIVPSGAELPYQSEMIRGLQLMPKMEEIAIPIKRRGTGSSYITIASGRVKLAKSYSNGCYVSILVKMSTNKVITMEMYLSSDLEGQNVLEWQKAELLVGEYEVANKNKIVAPSGTSLNAVNELHSLRQKCDQLLGEKSSFYRKIAYDDISSQVTAIAGAGNKADFAAPMLNMLENCRNVELAIRLFRLARAHSNYWTDKDRAKLAKICIDQLYSEFAGFSTYGLKRNANFQAIYALAHCGSDAQVLKLNYIRDNKIYRPYCLYAFGLRQLEAEWVLEQFEKDAAVKNLGKIGVSAHALGLAVRRGTGKRVENVNMDKVVNALCKTIEHNYDVSDNYSGIIVSCIIALGYACDQRYTDNTVSEKSVVKARELLLRLNMLYSSSVATQFTKSIGIAEKLMNGMILSAEEEQFLLKKIEID